MGGKDTNHCKYDHGVDIFCSVIKAAAENDGDAIAVWTSGGRCEPHAEFSARLRHTRHTTRTRCETNGMV